MKIKLITFSTISALSLGSFAFAQHPKGGNRHSVLEQRTERLNLTPEQKAKVQPIIDQTNPQIQTIRRDAMQKIKTLVDSAMAQIRPMLTLEQQKILDETQHERRGGLKSHGGQTQLRQKIGLGEYAQYAKTCSRKASRAGPASMRN